MRVKKNTLTNREVLVIQFVKDLEINNKDNNITSHVIYDYASVQSPQTFTYSALTGLLFNLCKKKLLFRLMNPFAKLKTFFTYSSTPFEVENKPESSSDSIDFDGIYNHLLNQVRPTIEKAINEERLILKEMYEKDIKNLEYLIEEKNKEINKWNAINTENQDVIRGYVCQIKDYIKKCQLQDADIQAQEKAKSNFLAEILKLKEDIKLLQNKNYNLLCKTKQEEFNEKVYELCNEIRGNK